MWGFRAVFTNVDNKPSRTTFATWYCGLCVDSGPGWGEKGCGCQGEAARSGVRPASTPCSRDLRRGVRPIPAVGGPTSWPSSKPAPVALWLPRPAVRWPMAMPSARQVPASTVATKAVAAVSRTAWLRVRLSLARSSAAAWSPWTWLAAFAPALESVMAAGVAAPPEAALLLPPTERAGLPSGFAAIEVEPLAT